MTSDEAEAIGRLSALEKLRDQAREGNRTAMTANIEKLIEAELRAIQRIRSHKAQKEDHPEA